MHSTALSASGALAQSASRWGMRPPPHPPQVQEIDEGAAEDGCLPTALPKPETTATVSTTGG